MPNTILEKLQEKYPNAEGIDDARNIAEAMACIEGQGGRGANAIADQMGKPILLYSMDNAEFIRVPGSDGAPVHFKDLMGQHDAGIYATSLPMHVGDTITVEVNGVGYTGTVEDRSSGGTSVKTIAVGIEGETTTSMTAYNADGSSDFYEFVDIVFNTDAPGFYNIRLYKEPYLVTDLVI